MSKDSADADEDDRLVLNTTGKHFDAVNGKVFIRHGKREVAALQIIGRTARFVTCRRAPLKEMREEASGGWYCIVDYAWLTHNPPDGTTECTCHELWTYRCDGMRYYYIKACGSIYYMDYEKGG